MGSSIATSERATRALCFGGDARARGEAQHGVSNSSGWRPSHEAELKRFNGRDTKNPGDGFLATLDSPTRALRCACTIRTELSGLVTLRGRLPTGLDRRAAVIASRRER